MYEYWNNLLNRAVRCTEIYGASIIGTVGSVHRSGIPDFDSVQVEFYVALEMQMATKKRSQVWENFEFLEKDGVKDTNTTVCKICAETFTYTTGSTSSMKAHLLRKHGITGETQSAKHSSKDCQVESGERGKSNSSSGQLKLSEMFKGQNKLKFSSPRHADITRSIGMFIAKDLRPYSVVENEGFKGMLTALEPRYDVPSRRHFAEKVIPIIK